MKMKNLIMSLSVSARRKYTWISVLKFMLSTFYVAGIRSLVFQLSGLSGRCWVWICHSW